MSLKCFIPGQRGSGIRAGCRRSALLTEEMPLVSSCCVCRSHTWHRFILTGIPEMLCWRNAALVAAMGSARKAQCLEAPVRYQALSFIIFSFLLLLSLSSFRGFRSYVFRSLNLTVGSADWTNPPLESHSSDTRIAFLGASCPVWPLKRAPTVPMLSAEFWHLPLHTCTDWQKSPKICWKRWVCFA